MKFIILGNSLVRGLIVPDTETISINGLDWERSVKHMVDNREKFRDAIVYIVIGPLRFTTMHTSRKEVVFNDNHLSTIKQLFAPFFSNLKFLHISPVICPLFPMSFYRYNSCREQCSHPIMMGFYKEWEKKLEGHIVLENREVFKFNRKRGYLTPTIHRRIFHRKKGHYVFRINCTRDGVHVKTDIKNEWAREFERIIRKEVSRFR